ncbi:MAG TPA: NAD(P)-dependent oxidoreductase [Solirubrobacteraceae bacterium]|nr:NAD(P)-dependent oxidoreductase [Solirubrobacteraceae bacterium]
MRVAVLGTGIMGAPMARNLRAAGHEVSAWNRSPEKAALDGIDAAGSIAEAVSGADVVVTMLADGDAVEAVAGEAFAAMDGAVLAQMSTIGVAATERVAERARAADVPFVDAPVLGTKQPAEQGALIVLASGPDDVRDRVAPVFDAVGAKTLWLGDAGAGSRLKLVINTWLLSLTEGLAEAIALAGELGVDPQTFLDTIDGGPIGAPYAQLKGKLMIDGDFPPSFPLDLALKDARLALAAAEERGLRLGALAAVAEQMERAVEAGHGSEDMAATIHASRPA